MDNFQLKPERKKVNRKPLVWNVLTVVVLLGTCCMAYYFLTIFSNPDSIFNPFPPLPLPTSFQTETPTSTIIPRESTWTPTVTIQPSPSRTKAPTWTLLPQMITPSITSTPTVTSTEPTPVIAPGDATLTPTITFQPSPTH